MDSSSHVTWWRTWSPNPFLLFRCAFLVILLSAAVAAFGVAVQMLVTLPTLFATLDPQLHAALAWAAAAGFMTTFCIVASAVPATAPRHFTLPVFFEVAWAAVLPIVNIIAVVLVNQEAALFCAAPWRSLHRPAEYTCSGLQGILTPALILLVACSILYACILACAVYHHRTRTAPTHVLLADLYALPWFARPSSAPGARLEKRNIHGLVISKPNAWGTYDFTGQRPASAAPPFLATSTDLWDGLDADCEPQGRRAPSLIETGTTYGGKIPRNGFGDDHRAPWARAAAAALVRGRHAPFPAPTRRAVPALVLAPPPPVHARQAHRSVHPEGESAAWTDNGEWPDRPESGATAYARPAAPTPTRAKMSESPRLRVENWGSREGTLASPRARGSSGGWSATPSSASMSSLGRELSRTEGGLWVFMHPK